MTLENGSIIRHYKISSSIGKGGMGEVYLAEDTKLDRRVALKILPAEFAEDKDRMSRFVREAKSASALNHPNIITIHEIGESEGTHFIATEFIDGKTLSEYAKSNPLNFKSALEIAIQIGSALDEAHSAGIVHRDIKPDNVMIRENGLAKILDFGIAKLSAPFESDAEAATAIKSGTSPGMIIGTANYMSPEQAKGQTVDARTDIFSFGVVLYEMLAGHLPFEGESAMEMIGAILKDEPKLLPSDVPGEITKIINQCLRKDADERYQTIRNVLNDLKDVKQDLEFQDKLERSVVPNRDENKTQILPAATLDETNRTTTNQTVASHPTKKYLAIALAVLLVSAIGFFGYRSFAPNKQIESIAVMPFVNESGNADVEYLSDGMTETLISSLSQLPKLNVKARSSVFRYKGRETDAQTVGRELNVQAILNGRVVQRGEQLTLYLELVDAQTGNRIWGEQYNRKQTNLVSLQSEIARDVSQKLKTKLSGADEQKLAKNYTENTEAYQLYLQGRFYSNKRTAKDLQKAIDFFNRAIATDPNYALAFAGLAEAYAVLPNYRGASANETLPKAKAAALKALSLDNDLAEAHTALGLITHLWSYDFAGAEREYKRAIELNPNYASAHQNYGNLVSTLGKHEESLAKFRRALEIDPFSLVINRAYGERFALARRYDEAIAQLKKTLELDAGFLSARYSLAAAYQMNGNYAECVEELAKSQELMGEPQAAASVRESYAKNGWQGFLRMITEERLQFNSPWDNLTVFHAALGEKDKAFNELNKAYENRETFMVLLKVDPRLDPLRDDPRFQELLRKVGFPQ
jgi:serine/threonine-protein kinase